MMNDQLPEAYQEFIEGYPELAEAYRNLGETVHRQGPLDEKTRALVKVAIAGGARLEGAFHSHVRKARAAGASRKELEHIVFLTLPTLGFPHMMMLLTWLEDEFVEE